MTSSTDGPRSSADNPGIGIAASGRGRAAGRTKRSYLGAQYRRLAVRRGRKRALLAVGHSLRVIFSHMLNSDLEYRDPGVEYLDRLDPERLRRDPVKRLERLGYQVTLMARDEAA